jgi:Gdp/GTP exchange factor required for growth at low temperatures
LVGIIAALRSEWVTKAAKRSWTRVGVWESRMYHDLVAVTSPGSDFRFLRQEVEAAIESKPIIVSPHDTSTSGLDSQTSTASRKNVGDSKVHPRSFCIPFLGWFVSRSPVSALANLLNRNLSVSTTPP